MIAYANLEDYLAAQTEQVGSDTVPGHIYEHGRGFESAALLPHEADFIGMIDWENSVDQECWRNCHVAALTLPEVDGITLRYVEGYLMPGINIPVEHAWLSVNGKVVDLTVRVRDQPYDRVRGVFPPDWEYWGVELLPAACEHTLSHAAAGPLIDDWQCGWPLIPGRHAKVRRTAVALT